MAELTAAPVATRGFFLDGKWLEQGEVVDIHAPYDGSLIARVHRGGRLPLVHVDAYRLGSVAEVDDLDLDAVLEESVTVVEWGAGLVEDLAVARLEVRSDAAGGHERGQRSPQRRADHRGSHQPSTAAERRCQQQHRCPASQPGAK